MKGEMYCHMRKYTFVIILIGFIFTSAYAAEKITVGVDVANIRSGAGIKKDILWKVEKYHPFIVIKRSGLWINVRDFEGDNGWIHKSLIRNISSVIVTVDKSNIRSGPGKSNKILFTAEKGIPFKVLKRKGNWINVVHSDGDKGWIHKSLLW